MREKRKIKRKMRRKRALRIFFFILILVLVYSFAFQTEFFSVVDIEVQGNIKTKYDELIKASHFNKGNNIFKINVKIGEEALEELPYIKDAKIKRKFPENIIIEVNERKEIALVSYMDSFLYIDEEGYILSIVEKEEKVELPKIFDLELEESKIGENIYEKIKDENIEEFILSSNKAKVLPLMRSVSLSDRNNIIIELKDNIKVAFGPLNNVKYKLSFLSEILEDIKKKDINARKIILNKGDNPIILTDEQ